MMLFVPDHVQVNGVEIVNYVDASAIFGNFSF